MSGIATAIVTSAVVGGHLQGKAAKKAGKIGAAAQDAAIEEQRAAREEARRLNQPFVDLGVGASEQMQAFLSDDGTAELNFRRQEGFEDIQESAAARGRLGAGGTLRDLTSFNTDLTSTLQNQRFNQLFNVLGLGQNAAAGVGSQAIQTGSNIGNLLGNKANIQGNAAINQGNVQAGMVQNLSGAFGAFGGFGGTNAGQQAELNQLTQQNNATLAGMTNLQP